MEQTSENSLEIGTCLRNARDTHCHSGQPHGVTGGIVYKRCVHTLIMACADAVPGRIPFMRSQAETNALGDWIAAKGKKH